jgi:spore germination protein YaaH
MQYQVQLGDTLFALARRFGVSPDDLARWNNVTTLEAGTTLNIREPAPSKDTQMSNETPKPEDSEHAADHIEGLLDSMDAVFGEIKGAAQAAAARLRAEGEEMKGNIDTFDQRITGRMRLANQRFRRFVGGNGGPPLDDVKVIEHKE